MLKRVLEFGGLLLVLAAFLTMGPGGWALAGQEGQNPQYDCSIKVPAPEPANLAPLAKLTPDQAKAAAQAARPNFPVKQVELENENGCLIYDVEFADGWEIKIDAGNGKVLYQHQEGPEKKEK